MMIVQVFDQAEKRRIARSVLEALTDWFGIEEAREEYIASSADLPFFAAYDGETPIGFVCLKETGRDTAELFVIGVKREYHRSGVGRRLFEAARADAAERGYSFLQVKTVRMGCYEEYDRTNRFYLALGFREFEVFPTLWDECNPCQIYVMALK
ncbi:MAG: GNAT family N-acetyltransferase [Clostridia bacterium]|nr:GNAT family N-acetyltransferase [Clostridia bacterium]